MKRRIKLHQVASLPQPRRTRPNESLINAYGTQIVHLISRKPKTDKTRRVQNEQTEMLARVDEVLATLPQDRIAMQLAVRYAGTSELQQKITSAVEMLKQLKTDLQEEGDENV